MSSNSNSIIYFFHPTVMRLTHLWRAVVLGVGY